MPYTLHVSNIRIKHNRKSTYRQKDLRKPRITSLYHPHMRNFRGQICKFPETTDQLVPSDPSNQMIWFELDTSSDVVSKLRLQINVA